MGQKEHGSKQHCHEQEAGKSKMPQTFVEVRDLLAFEFEIENRQDNGEKNRQSQSCVEEISSHSKHNALSEGKPPNV